MLSGSGRRLAAVNNKEDVTSPTCYRILEEKCSQAHKLNDSEVSHGYRNPIFPYISPTENILRLTYDSSLSHNLPVLPGDVLLRLSEQPIRSHPVSDPLLYVFSPRISKAFCIFPYMFAKTTDSLTRKARSLWLWEEITTRGPATDKTGEGGVP